jgi:hypothetical protein
MLDPASRFLDSDDAGGQTKSMAKICKTHKGPIYTCELDKRCPGLIEYPIDEIVSEFRCYYLNNTVAYAIAFALWCKVGTLKLFGIDFTYKGNLHFAESGRACVEFWLCKSMERGMTVEVANSSYLLDTAIPGDERLYGYHRLDDPKVILADKNNNYRVFNKSQVQTSQKQQEVVLMDRYDSHLKKNKVGEPNKW